MHSLSCPYSLADALTISAASFSERFKKLPAVLSRIQFCWHRSHVQCRVFPHSCDSHLDGCIAELQASSWSPCAWRSNGAAGFWMPANQVTAPQWGTGGLCSHPTAPDTHCIFQAAYGAGRCSHGQDVTQGCSEQAGLCGGRIQLAKCLAPSWLPQLSPGGSIQQQHRCWTAVAGLQLTSLGAEGQELSPSGSQRWCRGRGWLSIHSLVQGPALLP